MARFESMSVSDVRERAEAFATSPGPTQPAPKPTDGAVDNDVQVRALVADAHHRDVAEKWSELERVLLKSGIAVVGDLPERERMRWARRLNALSSVFGHPAPPRIPHAPAVAASGQPPQSGLKSNDPTERQMAVRRLGEARTSTDSGLLAHVLATDPAEAVRAGAARGLASTGGPEARTALLDATSDSLVVRTAIADALGLLREPAAVPKLATWLASPTLPAAIEALGRIGDPSVVPRVARFLSDPSRTTRKLARDALIDIGDPHALNALRANPRRNAVSRSFDTRASQRAIARRELRARRQLPRSVDRVTTRLRSLVLKVALAATAIVLIDVLMLGAPALSVLGITLVVGTLLSICVLFAGRSGHDLLDAARWRAEPCAQPPRVAPSWSTLLYVLTLRPIGVSVFIAFPLACDALLGGLGILPGLTAALLIGLATSRARAAHLVDHWLTASRTSLLVERTRARDLIERLRVFEPGG